MPALILFIKNPIPGQTKTRLAAEVGNEMALKMYHVLTDWTRQQALGLANTDRYLYYSNDITADDNWPATDFHKHLQHGPGLGERMENAFAEVFAAGHQRAVIIGSDCPGITTAYLENAFAALQDHDLVIGPALDGGYTLLGLRQPAPVLFRDMAWSTDEVLSLTLARAAAAGLRVKQLPALSDVDYLADWQHYGWPLP